MKLNKKIPAFTLGEIIVVLILTSVVVGLAFSILHIVQSQVKSIQKNFEFAMELNKLEQSFYIDFNRFSKVEYNLIEDTLLFSSELENRTYYFNSDYLVKDKDTFHIPFNQKQFYFDGNVVTSGMIDALKFETSESTGYLVLFVFRQNDATLYMN